MEPRVETSLARTRCVVDFLVRVAAADVARSLGEVELARTLATVPLDYDAEHGVDAALAAVARSPGCGPDREQVITSVTAALRYARYAFHLAELGELRDGSAAWIHRAADSAERAASTVARTVWRRRGGPLLPGTRTELVAMLMQNPPMPAHEAIGTLPVLAPVEDL